MLYNSRYNELSDLELIEQYRQGEDKVLVGVLFKRYSHLVLGLCIKYLKDEDEAKDAVMQIFTKLMEALLQHKVEYFKSWLYVFSKNHCLMILRKRQTVMKNALELEENYYGLMENGDPLHPNTKAEEKEQQILQLEKAILELSPEQRTCVRLFYLEEKSYHEIVAITGYSNNEVKSYIQNGKRNLKIKLSDWMNES